MPGLNFRTRLAGISTLSPLFGLRPKRGAASTAQYLVAASYALNKRVVLDAGFSQGLTSDTPKYSAFGGMTVLIGKLH